MQFDVLNMKDDFRNFQDSSFSLRVVQKLSEIVIVQFVSNAGGALSHVWPLQFYTRVYIFAIHARKTLIWYKIILHLEKKKFLTRIWKISERNARRKSKFETMSASKYSAHRWSLITNKFILLFNSINITH